MHISSKCSIAVHCLIFIHEYGAKKRVTSELLALSTGCNPVTIRTIISALKKDGMISVKFGPGGATLNCPPETITLHRICMTVEPEALEKLIGIHAMPSPFCPVGRRIHDVLKQPYDKIRRDLEDSLRSITLKEMIEEYQRKVAGD